MTRGELLDRKRAGTVEMPAQVCVEPGKIEFFACSYGTALSQEAIMGSEFLCLYYSFAPVKFLPICEQALVLEMRVRVERAERETLTRTQKLRERGIVRHPSQFQRVHMR